MVEEKEEEDVCEHCGGSGEVDVMGSVYPNEPHQALVDTQKCICQLHEEDEYDNQE